VIAGGVCRLLIHKATAVGALAAAAAIAAPIWTEVYFNFPLSHDTAESSTWRSYLVSALHNTWPYGAAGVIAIIAGWHLANHIYSRRRPSVGKASACD